MKKLIFLTLLILLPITSLSAESLTTIRKRFSGYWSGWGYISLGDILYDYKTLDFELDRKGRGTFTAQRSYWLNGPVIEAVSGRGSLQGKPSYASIMMKRDHLYYRFKSNLSDGTQINAILEEYRTSKRRFFYRTYSCKFRSRGITGYCNFSKDPV